MKVKSILKTVIFSTLATNAGFAVELEKSIIIAEYDQSQEEQKEDDTHPSHCTRPNPFFKIELNLHTNSIIINAWSGGCFDREAKILGDLTDIYVINKHNFTADLYQKFVNDQPKPAFIGSVHVDLENSVAELVTQEPIFVSGYFGFTVPTRKFGDLIVLDSIPLTRSSLNIMSLIPFSK